MVGRGERIRAAQKVMHGSAGCVTAALGNRLPGTGQPPEGARQRPQVRPSVFARARLNWRASPPPLTLHPLSMAVGGARQ